MYFPRRSGRRDAFGSLKAHLPLAGCCALAVTFNRVFAHRKMTVTKSFVHQVLLKHAHDVLLVPSAS
jgi:hypothetical protein